jgi:hypothetical protein
VIILTPLIVLVLDRFPFLFTDQDQGASLQVHYPEE